MMPTRGMQNMRSPVHQEGKLWKAVDSGRPAETAEALQALFANRASLGKLTLDHAQPLLRALQYAYPTELASASQSACLYLLARWCRSAPTGFGQQQRDVLSRATLAALAIASKSDQSGQLSSAACLFLSCAAVALEDRRRACQQSICQALHTERGGLVQSRLLPALLGSLGRLCATEQETVYVLWTVGLMLQLWEPADGPPSASDDLSLPAVSSRAMLNQMGALYPSLRAVATGLLSQQPAHAAVARLWQLLALLEATQEGSGRELRSAGVLAAAGMLEGCTKATKPLAKGHPICQQLAQLLTAACQQADQGSSGDRSRAAWLLQQCAALGFVQAHQACGIPEASEAAVRCQLQVLLAEVLSLDALFLAAADRQPVTMANDWLLGKVASLNMQAAGSYARFLVQQYGSAPAALQHEMQDALRHSVQALHSSYAAYTVDTPSEWLEAVDRNAVRQVLDKAFMTSILLLTAFWEAAAPVDRGRLAVTVLDQLSLLQFAHMRLTAYSTLLRAVLTAAAQDDQACLALLQRMPCYADLIAPAAGQTGRMRWEADPVLAAEMQFRMSLLGPCTPRLPQEAALERTLPAVYLYLAHSHSSVVAAAHSLFCAILQIAPEKEQLAPFYVTRALANYPQHTPLLAFTTGMDALARSIPSGNSMPLFCLKCISERAVELMAAEPRVKDAMGLVHLLAYLLLVVDIQVLEAALEQARDLVLACPEQHRHKVSDDIGKVLASSDDYARKVVLVRWFQETQSKL